MTINPLLIIQSRKNVLIITLLAFASMGNAQLSFKPSPSDTINLGAASLLHSTLPLTRASLLAEAAGFRRVEDNLHDANYFIGPSARPYIKGYGLFRNHLLLLNSVGYGISKNFSAAVGLEFSSLFRNEAIFFASGKAGFEAADNLNIAGGYLIVTTPTEAKVSQSYAVVTFGDQELNISLGASLGRFQGIPELRATYNASGFYQFTDFVGFMSENHIIPTVDGEAFYLGFQGCRFVTGDNGIDVGFAYTTAKELAFEWTILPFFGYNLLF